jgi:serine/threonine-protein kinase
MSDWSIIEKIVDQALEVPFEKREQFIRDKCGNDSHLRQKILSYLNSIQQSTSFFSKADKALSTVINTSASSRSAFTSKLIGSVIDKYEIVDLISHGGMGTVFLAQRVDGVYEQTVALKIVRHGMETPENICRFEKEREILAGLNHPNIARLIDGGVTDFGLPYLVMEYVDGTPIDEYCENNKLTISQRIELVISLCNAVQFAHNNLVIHRDLKPANILIDKNGHVKILDFGIAKLVEDRIDFEDESEVTSTHAVTPAYAAPEQITGNSVTTSTDTYSMGVLLYKLLVGVTPFNLNDVSPFSGREKIVNQEPLKPSLKFSQLTTEQRNKFSKSRLVSASKLFKILKVDLDAILLKSLRKEACKRYQTIDNLVEDLKRYLSNKPVFAHQGSFSYRTKKLVRRNYKQIFVAAAIILLSVTFAIFHSNRITEEKNIAQYEAMKTAEISSLLFDLFEANTPDQSLGETVTAQELLERGLNRAEKLVNQPELQAQMFGVIGKVYLKIGNVSKSKSLIDKSVDIYTRVYGKEHPETALAIASQALVQSSIGNYSDAEMLYDYALGVLEDHSGAYLNKYTDSINEQGYVLRRQGKYEEAEEVFRKNYNLLKDQHGELNPKVVAALNGVGVTQFNRGYYERAENIFREVLEKRIQIYGDTHPDIAESKNSLGALLMNLGQFKEAEKLFEDAFYLRNRILGENHPKTLLTLNNLAILQRDRGKFDLSATSFEKVISKKEKRFGTNTVASAISYFSYGELLLMMERFEEANTQFNKSLQIFEDFLGDDHSFTARSKMNLGTGYLYTNKIDEAERLIQEGYDKVIEIHSENTLERAIADHQFGIMNIKKGNYQLAGLHLEKSLDAFNTLERNESARSKIVLKDIQMLKQVALSQ